MHFTCNQHYIKNMVTTKHKNNYCKKDCKAKPSLKRRLESVHSFFSFYCTFLVFEHAPRLSFSGEVVLRSLFHNLVIWAVSCNPLHTEKGCCVRLRGWSVVLRTHEVVMNRQSEMSPLQLLWKAISRPFQVLCWIWAPCCALPCYE